MNKSILDAAIQITNSEIVHKPLNTVNPVYIERFRGHLTSVEGPIIVFFHKNMNIRSLLAIQFSQRDAAFLCCSIVDNQYIHSY